ncbi:hypothetical protein RD110_18585 [Rhodoferax koreense]|uniref:Phage tail tape measure protein n=1 Tax=Rhodoferax koreensis TaxID=1842727 RepID=A0A1P8JYX7_9BURK|nr:hypothetical protein [Rhodoferax koreense]APW38962.1 hypothetical protein RD110_18585 [Rhodoferax koreense]
MDKFTLKAILSAVDNLSPVLKSVQGVAKTTRKYLGDVGTSINNLTSKFGVPLGIMSTIAAGFGVAAVKHAVVSFTELAESLQNGAIKAGMTSDQFQRMKYVADQAALPIDVLQLSMGKLNKGLGAAAMGKNDSLLGLMKALKIPLKDASGQMRTAADLLPEIAESFKLNEDPVKRAAMGTALFGKAYQEMLPFLSEGREGIDQSLARFAKLKGTIPEADIRAAKEFGDKLQDLDFVTKGFQSTIARELIPVLSPLVEGFVQWAAASKKVVGAQVKKVVQELVAGLQSIDWESFLNGIRSSIDALKSAVDQVGGLKNALVILAVIMNAQTIFAIGGIIGSLIRLAGAFGGASLAAWNAAGAFLASAAASGSVTAVMTASLAAAAKSAGLIGAAGLVGYAVGSAIYKAIEDWDFTKALGEGIARVLAFFGNENAKRSLEVTDAYAKTLTRPVAQAAPAFRAMGPQVRALGPVVRNAAAAAAPLAESLGPQSFDGSTRAPAPGQIGSGSFNLVQPSNPTATLNGKVDINFANAPPGMRVEQAQSTAPRVAVNTNVGYRSLATDTGF